MTRPLLRVAAVAVLLLAGTGPTSAAPVSGVDCPPSLAGCVTAGDGGLDVAVTAPGSGAGPAAPAGARPARAPAVPVERSTAPACTGNGPDHDLLLCASALARCPDGEVAVWTWFRTRPRDAAPGPWERDLDPSVRCVGAGSPALPTAASLAAAARRAFRHLALPVPVVGVRPAGTTLVGIPTSLSVLVTGTPRTTTTLLGVAVHVEARVLRTTWRTGERTVVRSGAAPLVHRFGRAGRRSVQAAVEWGATYRVGPDGPALPVLGTVTTTSAAVPVVVRTARARLVG